MICSCVLAGESIRKDQWETQQLCFTEQGCICCQCCVITVHLPALFLTLAEEPQCHPTLSSIMDRYIPSTACVTWGAFLSWQNGDFPCSQADLPAYYQWLARASFHVPTLSLRGPLMHPPKKASSFGVVWVSKFPSLFSVAATQMFTQWRPSWSFTFESCQSLSSPLPNTKTFFLVDSYSQKMRERSVILLICLLRGCSQESM